MGQGKSSNAEQTRFATPEEIHTPYTETHTYSVAVTGTMMQKKHSVFGLGSEILEEPMF